MAQTSGTADADGNSTAKLREEKDEEGNHFAASPLTPSNNTDPAPPTGQAWS